MGLQENSSWLSNIYDAFKDTALTEFSFFDEALLDPTVYSLALDVTSSRCEHGLLVDNNIELPGKLQWRSVAQARAVRTDASHEIRNAIGSGLDVGSYRSVSALEMAGFAIRVHCVQTTLAAGC